MESKDLDLLIRKFLAGKCTQEEEKYLITWYENMPLLEAHDMTHMESMLWTTLKKDAMLTKVKQHRAVHFAATLKVAASVVLLIGLTAAIFFGVYKNGLNQNSSNYVSKINHTKDTEYIHLEDGSTISLQPNSELKYPEHFSGVNREVSLTGEAFFDIVPDKSHPFIVHAKDVTTRVLGTSFTIKAFDDAKGVSVVVRTGKVLVTTPKETTVLTEENLLTPNQQLVFDRSSQEAQVSLIEKPVVIEEVPLLNMKFTKVPVTEIFEALEQAYKVDIQFDDQKMMKCRLTTDLTENEDLYDRIRFICHAIGVKYTIQGMVIVIEGQGCK